MERNTTTTATTTGKQKKEADDSLVRSTGAVIPSGISKEEWPAVS